MKRFLLILPFLLLLTLQSNAQVTTATIIGKIVDDKGEPLFGATVVAIHTPSGSQYGTITRENGRFSLPNLRVGGPYTIEASYVGLEPQEVTGIQLSIAQKLKLNFTLKTSAISLEGVTIVGSSDPDMNSDRTGAATYVGEKQLEALPTISRSASDYYRLTPSSSGNSFGGRNDQYNNFSLDGSIFNNPFGLDAATPGGQTDAQPVSLDAIEQIQVSMAPYDVTQAGFTGAAINAVTKSGTNKFKGTVFGFFRNQSMTGGKVRKEKIFVPDLKQYQAGFSLGGPIIKDKVFFFANFELDNRDDLGSHYKAYRGEDGGQISRVPAVDLERVSKILKDSFNYETGPYEGFTHATDSYKGLLKLDFVLSKKHSITATYNFLNASKDKPAHPEAIGRRGPDKTTLQFYNSGYQINNQIQSGIIEFKSLFSSMLSNKLQVGYTFFNDFRNPFSEPFPVLNINQDGVRAIVVGHEPFSIHNRLKQHVWQFTDNLNYYMGDHTFTAGFSLEKFEFDNSFNLGVYEPFGFNGTFGAGFESVDAFVDSVNTGYVGQAVRYARNVYNTNGGDDGEEGKGWALAETNVGQGALYLQDEWNVMENLKITAGVRVDKPLYFDTKEKIKENLKRNPDYAPEITWYDENGDSLHIDHTVLPDDKPLINPRIGFNWDVNGDRSLQLRGGTGLFSGRFPFVWIGNQVANPNWYFYCSTAPNFKFPQVWRSNIGVDKRFGKGLVASIDLIYTKDKNAMMVRNYGLNTPSGKLDSDFDDRLVYEAGDKATFNGFGFPIPVNGYIFTNTNVGSSFNASFEVKKSWAAGMFASLAYNYLKATDASSIEAEISSDAYDRNPTLGNVNIPVASPSLYGNKHRVVGSFSKKIEYGNMATTFSTVFEYAKGGRFSYTYAGDINNDGSGQNDLIYIPTDAQVDAMTFSGTAEEQTAQKKAFKEYIAQDDYLSANRGQYAEKYAILSPWYSDWDVRILQDIKVGENKVQVSFDILNFGNLLNSKWGIRQFPVNKQPIAVEVHDLKPTYTFDTSLKNTFNDDFSLLSRWQAKVGLRFIF